MPNLAPFSVQYLRACLIASRISGDVAKIPPTFNLLLKPKVIGSLNETPSLFASMTKTFFFPILKT